MLYSFHAVPVTYNHFFHSPVLGLVALGLEEFQNC